MFIRSLIALCGIASYLAMPGVGAAEPMRLRIDWSVVPSQFAPLIPTVPQYGPDVYRHYGKSYVVEPIRLQGGGESLTALATGQIDISDDLTPLTLVIGVVNAKLDLRVIGQVITTELPGYQYTYFWVRAADVQSVQDLKGKTIAVNAVGSNVDSAARIIMRRNGMIARRDYQVVEMPFPTMIPAINSKRVDVVPLVPPFDRMAARDTALKPIFSVGDAFGPVETLMFMTTASFIAKHRPLLVDFLEDNMRMRRWMTDPKTRPAAVQQLSDTTKIPIKAYEDWVYTHQDYYYDPHAMLNIERLQQNVNTLKEAGVAPATIDVSKYVDMSIAKEAAARLKN